MDLQEFALADQVTNRHRLKPQRSRLAPAAVPFLLQLDQLGQPGNQL
jgi:hypothetical protein